MARYSKATRDELALLNDVEVHNGYAFRKADDRNAWMMRYTDKAGAQVCATVAITQRELWVVTATFLTESGATLERHWTHTGARSAMHNVVGFLKHYGIGANTDLVVVA